MSTTWRRLRAAAVVAVLAAGALVGAASPSAAQIATGSYLIKNDASGPDRCLRMDSRNFPNDPGPLVGMVPCNRNDRFQVWRINPVFPQPIQGMEFYFIQNSANGWCLDADNRGGSLTWVVHVIGCHGGTTNYWQQWSIPRSGSGRISALALSPLFGLDNSGDGSGGFGQRVNYWPLSSTYNPKQTFSFHPTPGVL